MASSRPRHLSRFRTARTPFKFDRVLLSEVIVQQLPQPLVGADVKQHGHCSYSDESSALVLFEMGGQQPPQALVAISNNTTAIQIRLSHPIRGDRTAAASAACWDRS